MTQLLVVVGESGLLTIFIKLVHTYVVTCSNCFLRYTLLIASNICYVIAIEFLCSLEPRRGEGDVMI